MLKYIFQKEGNKSLRNRISRVMMPFIFTYLVLELCLLKWMNKPLVLVYTNGKCGSTSVMAGLKMIGIRAFQIHFLDKQNVSFLISENLKSSKGAIPLHLLMSKAWNLVGPVNYSVIVVKREGIGDRWLSIYLQQLDRFGVINLGYDDIDQLSTIKSQILFEDELWFRESRKVLMSNQVIVLNFKDAHLWEEILRRYNIDIKIERKNDSKTKYYHDYAVDLREFVHVNNI